jgi:hypothetical protein
MKTNEKGISVYYTIFPECSSFKGRILVSEERIRRAKRIIEKDSPYHLSNCKDKIESYLFQGVIIDVKKEFSSAEKDDWEIRLRCEKTRKGKLEQIIKHLRLNSDE